MIVVPLRGLRTILLCSALGLRELGSPCCNWVSQEQARRSRRSLVLVVVIVVVVIVVAAKGKEMATERRLSRCSLCFRDLADWLKSALEMCLASWVSRDSGVSLR